MPCFRARRRGKWSSRRSKSPCQNGFRDSASSCARVKLFDLALPAKFARDVVILEQNLDRPKVTAFRQWLFDQVALGPGGVQPPRPRLKP